MKNNKKKDNSRKQSGNERIYKDKDSKDLNYDLESGDNPDERRRIFPIKK